MSEKTLWTTKERMATILKNHFTRRDDPLGHGNQGASPRQETNYLMREIFGDQIDEWEDITGRVSFYKGSGESCAVLFLDSPRERAGFLVELPVSEPPQELRLRLYPHFKYENGRIWRKK